MPVSDQLLAIFSINTFEELMSTATQDNSSTIFDFGNGDALILENTQLAALDADMFSFF